MIQLLIHRLTQVSINLRPYSVLLLAVSLAACSQQQVYHGLQHSQRNECLQQPPSVIDECLEQTDTDYSDYQRQRAEVLSQSETRSNTP